MGSRFTGSTTFPQWALHLESVRTALYSEVGIAAELNEAFELNEFGNWIVPPEAEMCNEDEIDIGEGLVEAKTPEALNGCLNTLNAVLTAYGIPHDTYEGGADYGSGYRDVQRFFRDSSGVIVEEANDDHAPPAPTALLEKLRAGDVSGAIADLEAHVAETTPKVDLREYAIRGEPGLLRALAASARQPDGVNELAALLDRTAHLQIDEPTRIALLSEAAHSPNSAAKFDLLASRDLPVRPTDLAAIEAARPGVAVPPEAKSYLLAVLAKDAMAAVLAQSNPAPGRTAAT